MRCPHCGAAVTSDKKFCGDCGTSAAVAVRRVRKRESGRQAILRRLRGCPRDRRSTPHKLDARASSPERRLMTVVFVDLVGSTALGERLDPEDLRKVIADFHDLTSGLVTAFNGFIARYMGDGALIYFGYPQANETDAERAVRAGLAWSMRSRASIPWPVRRARSRYASASIAAWRSSVITSAPDRRARRRSWATCPIWRRACRRRPNPGTVVISEATRHLVGNLFEYRSVELANLKGRRDVERARMVLRESAIESRYEALRSGHLALVGREEELELLLRRWDQAKGGEGARDPAFGRGRHRQVASGCRARAARRQHRRRARCAISARPITSTRRCIPSSGRSSATPDFNAESRRRRNGKSSRARSPASRRTIRPFWRTCFRSRVPLPTA